MNYKILFLIFTLFFINNVNAEIILQEDFESQTTGNLNVISGYDTPSFVTTPPYGYYLFSNSQDVALENISLTSFNNFEYTQYIKIDASNHYNFKLDFYQLPYSAPYKYISFSFINQSSNLYNYYLECTNGIAYCTGIDINTIDLASYEDVDGYVKISVKLNDNTTYLYVNDILLNTNILDIGFEPSFSIFETYIDVDYPFAMDKITLDKITTSTTTITGTITYKDENINSSTYPLENALVFINSSYYNYTNALGEYTISNLSGIYPTTISKTGFGTITGNIDTSLTDNDFTLLFSKPSMTLPHIETGNKILSEYSNTQYPISLWNSPNFVWGVYRFSEFKDTEKDIDYLKPCNHLSGNTFSCELVLNKDYTFRIIYSDIYNYNLNTYHPFLSGNRNFSTGIITIGKDYTEIDNIKTISILPQKERESAFKNYFWEAIYVMIVILVLGLIFSSGKKS